MTLKDCTKEELISIIQEITRFDKTSLRFAISHVEYGRIRKKLADAERWSQVSDSCRTKYIEFLKKYEGIKIADIPIDELEEAKECLENADRADKEYNRLIKEVDAYESNKH